MWSEVNYKVVPLFALQLVLGLNWEKNFWVEINCLRRWTSSLLDLYFLPFRSCWFPRPRPPPPTQHRHQLIDGVRFYNTRCVWANDMERVINRNIRPAFPWRHTRTSSCHSPNERFVVQCWETRPAALRVWIRKELEIDVRRFIDSWSRGIALHPVTVSGDKQITEVLFYEFRFCSESCVCFANILGSVCLHSQISRFSSP